MKDRITYERLLAMSETELHKLAADPNTRKIVQQILHRRSKSRHNKQTFRQMAEHPYHQ